MRFMHRHDLLRNMSEVLCVLTTIADPGRGGRRGRWSVQVAGIAACLMAWSTAPALMDRFADAMKCLGRVLPAPSRGHAYNGLFKALARQWRRVEGPLKNDLRRRATELMGRVNDWFILAVDGSKIELPRTRANRRGFGIADNGAGPQAFVTAIVHVLTGLVLDWRIGPARSSERGHLASMIKHLPPRTLLLMDAYYVGYDLWTALIKHQTHWLMRVGANVRLIQDLIPGCVTIDRRAGIVYVWRRPAARSSPDEEPLCLRLIRVGGRKNGIYLLTTVLDPARMSRKRAGELYRMRWGVEVFYRSIKQIMGATKLGSRTPTRARLELNWTIIAAAALALLSAGVLRKRRIDPARWSFAGALRIVRCGLHEELLGSGPRRRGLITRLAEALKDTCKRTSRKRSRHRPRTTSTPARIQPPKIEYATESLRQRARHANPVSLAA